MKYSKFLNSFHPLYELCQHQNVFVYTCTGTFINTSIKTLKIVLNTHELRNSLMQHIIGLSKRKNRFQAISRKINFAQKTTHY